ncbi:hypothetical protein [Streptomyces sp. NPDC050428]|uniref:hypothetical protein n=1 Tax=Streptomyces sp. NPDC050428 TaxID=3155757 RepID=UPI0034462557
MTARLPSRPVRDPDPVRNTAYWERIDRMVAAAPPLSDRQRRTIRAVFSSSIVPCTREAA